MESLAAKRREVMSIAFREEHDNSQPCVKLLEGAGRPDGLHTYSSYANPLARVATGDNDF